MRITLCGSGRFEKGFKAWNRQLSLRGHVVYGLSSYASENEGQKDWFTPTQKITLDLVHLAKIENSDAILVINEEGYIGESTTKEIIFAQMRGKRIYALIPFTHLDTSIIRDVFPGQLLL